MIFRALFWIGLVAVLMPHEPDLGFGRPELGGLNPARVKAMDAFGPAAPRRLCGDHASACAGGLAFLANFRAIALSDVAQVKAEIEASRKARENERRDAFAGTTAIAAR